MKFFIKDFFGKCPNLQETAYLVTFIEEIHNEKLHFFVQCKQYLLRFELGCFSSISCFYLFHSL